MENFLGSRGADGSRTDPPRHELELHSQDSEQGKTGKTPGWGWKGLSRLSGKGGRCPWKSGIISQGLVLLFLCRAPVREYPWPALEFLWEGAVWLGNCWLLRIQLSLRWDLLCSRNFPTLQQLLLWGGFYC